MTKYKLSLLLAALQCAPLAAQSHSADPCAALSGLKIGGTEITKAALVPAGTAVPPPYPGAPSIGPLPAHCRVDGIINRRKGVDGVEFGIGFALALPENAAWNGDFMMQGGGGGNGIIAYPAGANYAGDEPALSRGFAVASTDTGHKAKTGAFDFTFMRDQQAYLDFAFLANAEVAGVAKQIIGHYYAKPAAYSYFVGCSTGGREGMILSQRYPTVFNGIVSGDPAMRTGLSNLAIAQWIPVAYNQAAPKDASGKPQIDKFLTDDDRKLFMDALMKQCDAKDGVADGMISDPLGCDFDPRSSRASPASPTLASLLRKPLLSRKPSPDRRMPMARRSIPAFFMTRALRSKASHPGLLALGHRVASSALTPPQLNSTSTKRRSMPPIRSSSPRPPTSLRSHSAAASSSSSTATVIRGSRRSTRSAITNHLPRPTAEPRRFPNGAACFSSPGWPTAAAVPRSITSTCSPQSSVGSRKALRPTP